MITNDYMNIYVNILRNFLGYLDSYKYSEEYLRYLWLGQKIIDIDVNVENDLFFQRYGISHYTIRYPLDSDLDIEKVNSFYYRNYKFSGDLIIYCDIKFFSLEICDYEHCTIPLFKNISVYIESFNYIPTSNEEILLNYSYRNFSIYFNESIKSYKGCISVYYIDKESFLSLYNLGFYNYNILYIMDDVNSKLRLSDILSIYADKRIKTKSLIFNLFLFATYSDSIYNLKYILSLLGSNVKKRENVIISFNLCENGNQEVPTLELDMSVYDYFDECKIDMVEYKDSV